jgi:uncharacterized protein involved in exopolysaccharide biosynthesis
MRVLLGIILGGILTVGAAYLLRFTQFTRGRERIY